MVYKKVDLLKFKLAEICCISLTALNASNLCTQKTQDTNGKLIVTSQNPQSAQCAYQCFHNIFAQSCPHEEWD